MPHTQAESPVPEAPDASATSGPVEALLRIQETLLEFMRGATSDPECSGFSVSIDSTPDGKLARFTVLVYDSVSGVVAPRGIVAH